MGGELLTFDEALAELQMATHELRSLVAQGEIRAFRDEDVLKFRRTDVLDLKKTRESQPGELVIEAEEAPPAAPAAEGEAVPGEEVKAAKHETDETELLAGIGQGESLDFLGLDEASSEGTDTAQTVVPTIEIADEDLIDDTASTIIPMTAGDDTDVLGQPPSPTGPPSLLADEDEVTEMATQEIQVGEGIPGAAPEEPFRFQDSATAEDVEIQTEDVAAAAASGVTAPRRAQQYRAEISSVQQSPMLLPLAIATFVILLFSVPIFYGLATDQAPNFAPYKGLIEFLRSKIG